MGTGPPARGAEPSLGTVVLMARVELLTAETAPLLAQPFYQRGDPGAITAALAHVPELMEVALPFFDSVFGATAVEARLKEIVVLRVSSANRCHYCVETHSGVAQRIGFRPAEVSALRGEAPAPIGWSDAELAVYAFASAISETPESAVEKLRPHFADAAVVELVAVAAATVMLNRFATALELPA